MNISQHLDKNNLHHAYLIEGAREQILPGLLSFFEDIHITTSGNPDFCHMVIDNFKIGDAFELRNMSSEKGFSPSKKIFLLFANSISLDAQNVLLKMFEEPTENTHFFVFVPDVNALLKTLLSRFYLISPRQDLGEEVRKEAEQFINMSLQRRIDFIKELLPKKDEEADDGEDDSKDSNRTKALKFLNALELTLHQKFAAKSLTHINFINHFFKVREFLRMPGSSAKNLMESVALVIPNFKE